MHRGKPTGAAGRGAHHSGVLQKSGNHDPTPGSAASSEHHRKLTREHHDFGKKVATKLGVKQPPAA